MPRLHPAEGNCDKDDDDDDDDDSNDEGMEADNGSDANEKRVRKTTISMAGPFLTTMEEALD